MHRIQRKRVLYYISSIIKSTASSEKTTTQQQQKPTTEVFPSAKRNYFLKIGEKSDDGSTIPTDGTKIPGPDRYQRGECH